MHKHLNITVFGRVQGVFFRSSATRIASELKINGGVKNQADGSVYIEAEGNQEDLDKFIAWCKKGPSAASVEKVDIRPGKLSDYSSFKIWF